MPKLKTNSGAKKRFHVTAKGRVKVKPAHMRHRLVSKPKSMKRKARKGQILNDMDTKVVLKNYLPYAQKRRARSLKKAEQLRNKQALRAAANTNQEAA